MGSTDTTRTHVPAGSGEPSQSDGFSMTPQDSGWDVPPVPLSGGFRAKLPTAPMLTPMRVGLVVAIVLLVAFLAWMAFAPVRGGPSPAQEIAARIAGALPDKEARRPDIPSVPFGMCGRDLGIFEVRVVAVREDRTRDGDPAIAVTIAVKNTSKDRKILYRPNRGGLYYTMHDGLGNELRHRPKPSTPWNHGNPARFQRYNIPLDPGEELTDEEFFDRPVPAAKELRMLTPSDLAQTPGDMGVAFGQHRFLIPTDQIVREAD